MKIGEFNIEHLKKDVIINHIPAVSWNIESDMNSVYQQYYQIMVRSSEELVWDSGVVHTQECLGILCGGKYQSYQDYSICLTVVDNMQQKDIRELAFSTGRMDTPWQAKWISGKGNIDDDAVKPTYHFRKKHRYGKKIKKAIASASALGCYDLYINGKRVSEGYFAPGYTQYTSRVLYQSYDVTEMCQEEDFTICAEVAGGWYTGRLGLVLDGNRFGQKRAFALELRVIYEDNSSELLVTDESWEVSTDGPRIMAGFFDGEVYNAEKEQKEWKWEQAITIGRCTGTGEASEELDRILVQNKRPGKEGLGTVGVKMFDEMHWQSIPALEEDTGVPVLAHEKIVPKIISQTKDEVIYDVGRNLAGIVCFEQLPTKEGQKIIIKHGEILEQGEVYTANLRTAKAEIYYSCIEGFSTYEPRFTYMGFRYFSVQTEGGKLSKLCTEGKFYVKELYSDMEQIGEFFCSNEMLNQLQKNIETSQKANFIDIPTDCPQRDERCGWSGDIAVFSSTAVYNMECSRFMNKWLRDVHILQDDNGKGFAPYIIPDNGMGRRPGGGTWGNNEHKNISAVWGDVAVLLPWNLYQSTGQMRVLKEHYAGMRAQVDYVRELLGNGDKDKNYIWKQFGQLGDWLAPGEGFLKIMMRTKWSSTAYWANSVHMVSQAAKLLGKEEDANYYRKLYERIRRAFRNTFVKGGHIRNGFQTAYALSICFNLLTKKEKELAAQDLVTDIKKRGNHLSTGFAGTPFLLFAVADSGYMEVAYDMLLQETFPSWLYSVKAGATSMWERWDALKEDGTVNHGKGIEDMVSFNHYSYGSVGDFLYRRVCGLEMTTPGYKNFRVAPKPGGDLRWARTTHQSPYGKISVEWKIQKNKEEYPFTLHVHVPVNTKAQIVMPDGKEETVGSGNYTFCCEI